MGHMGYEDQGPRQDQTLQSLPSLYHGHIGSGGVAVHPDSVGLHVERKDLGRDTVSNSRS
jgi:hypothetical protein